MVRTELSNPIVATSEHNLTTNNTELATTSRHHCHPLVRQAIQERTPPVRILYAVHGYGRGHATRTLAILPRLLLGNRSLLCLAGGDAWQALVHEYPVVQIPSLGYVYQSTTRRMSALGTAQRNIPAAMDLWLGGPTFRFVQDVFEDFRPDIVISDAEPWSHQVAATLRIPRISFDHFGLLVHCRPAMSTTDRLLATAQAWCYQRLMGTPDRALVSSFYQPPVITPGVRLTGTLLRTAVRTARTADDGHVLVYFNQGLQQCPAHVLQALDSLGLPVRLYCRERSDRVGNLQFRRFDQQAFLDDLAGCRAIISTAGNQLIGEAMHLRKPVLVVPEDCVEQRTNAAAVVDMGIGSNLRLSHVTAASIRQFLNSAEKYSSQMQQFQCDATDDAAEILEQYFRELLPVTSTPAAANHINRLVA